MFAFVTPPGCLLEFPKNLFKASLKASSKPRKVAVEDFPTGPEERGRPRSRSSRPMKTQQVQYLLHKEKKKSALVLRQHQQKDPEDYENDRVGKYAQYFQGNEISPIPEVAKTIEPRILSLIATDLKTRRLTGLKKETFKELLRTSRANISAGAVLQHGMSCCQRRSRLQKPQPIT